MTKSIIQGQHIRTMYSIWLIGLTMCLIPTLLFLGEEIYKNNDISKFYVKIFDVKDLSISYKMIVTSFVSMM